MQLKYTQTISHQQRVRKNTQTLGTHRAFLQSDMLFYNVYVARDESKAPLEMHILLILTDRARAVGF